MQSFFLKLIAKDWEEQENRRREALSTGEKMEEKNKRVDGLVGF